MLKSLTAKQICAIITWLRGFSGIPAELRNHDYKCGSEGFFIPLSDTLGLKMFSDTESAKRYYWWHRIIAAAGLGPNVYDYGEVSICGGTNWNGTVKHFNCGWFTVERVTVLDEILDDYDSLDEPEDMMRECSNVLFSELGIMLGDRHTGNYGLLDGKVVPVDLGPLYYYKPVKYIENPDIHSDEFVWLFAY